MDTVPYLTIFVYGSFFTISGIIIIYLIMKRLKNRGKEGFEERDN
jgi:flagellar biosynthesis protein FliR